MDSVVLRVGGPADGPAVAALHAASWQTAYAHILAETYRQNAVVNRKRLWQGRMAAWEARRMHLVLAERGADLVGFGCVLADAEPAHGILLDNLHVRPDLKGGGVGRLLLAACGKWIAENFPGQPMHLTCYADNRPSVAFYRGRGGIQSAPFDYPSPDGATHGVVRFVWAEPGRLAP